VETKREIESSGSDVEKAIAAGLDVLGVGQDVVKIEVLDEGSRGLLGIGARLARVRLTVEEMPTSDEEEPPAPAPVSAPVATVAAPESVPTAEAGGLSMEAPSAPEMTI